MMVILFVLLSVDIYEHDCPDVKELGDIIVYLVQNLHNAGYQPTPFCLLYLQAVVLYASTYVLVALSIDRLDAIARPMNFTGSGE